MAFVYYHREKGGNFGDDLNCWLWDRLLPGLIEAESDTMLIGIGTILWRQIPYAKKRIVFSSGIGYGAPPEGYREPGWHFLAVRGPLTARVLQLPEDKAISDGALMISLLPEFKPLGEQDRKGIVFMPHITAAKTGVWKRVCESAGVEYLDPTQDSIKTIQRIRSAELVLADAMHAAIVADTLRVPWVPLSTSPEINSFKWLDWSMSIGAPYKPAMLPPSCIKEKMRSLYLEYQGTRYSISTPTVENALSNYAIQLRKKQKIVSRASIRLHREFYRHVLEPVSSFAQRKLNDDNIKQFEKAVIAMENVKNTTSFLSDERVFSTKRHLLADRIEDFKRMANDC